jgi:hypothetical protein
MKGTRKTKKAQDLVRRSDRVVNIRMDNLSANETSIVRRIAVAGTVSTAGTGFIAAGFVTSDQARSLGSDFASFAARYTQFRVRAVRMRMYPLVDANTAVTAGGGAVTPHPTAIAMAAYKSNLSYGTYSSVCTGNNAKIFQGRERCIEYSIDWSNYPDAKFWSASNAAIPTDQVYGFQYQDSGTAPASAVSTTYYRTVLDWIVEFTSPS